jgi:hypothetical protein
MTTSLTGYAQDARHREHGSRYRIQLAVLPSSLQLGSVSMASNRAAVDICRYPSNFTSEAGFPGRRPDSGRNWLGERAALVRAVPVLIVSL